VQIEGPVQGRVMAEADVGLEPCIYFITDVQFSLH